MVTAFFIVQLTAALSLNAVVDGMVVAAGMCVFNSLAFHYIFGAANVGWAILVAVFFGALLVREKWRFKKCGVSRKMDS